DGRLRRDLFETRTRLAVLAAVRVHEPVERPNTIETAQTHGAASTNRTRGPSGPGAVVVSSPSLAHYVLPPPCRHRRNRRGMSCRAGRSATYGVLHRTRRSAGRGGRRPRAHCPSRCSYTSRRTAARTPSRVARRLP